MAAAASSCVAGQVRLDVRPGGLIRIDMRGPDGTVYHMKGVFHEIKEPERLVSTNHVVNAWL